VPEYAVAGIWAGRAHGASVLGVEDGVVTKIEPAAPGINKSAVTVLPGLVDRHVHLGLVDHRALAGGPVVEVHDLGWAPDEIAVLRDQPPAGVTVRVAGPFHTAPGGYPSGRSWAPAAAVRAVDSVPAARRAVADAVAAGYDILKVALHSGMPLLGDEVLRGLVSAAHDAGLPVVVHAEGAGQAVRAIDAGADLLAHAPWTERVPDDALARGAHMTWCSTLAIHSRPARATAIDNIRRFRALGGRVVYGTDMGNGPTPVGVNAREILALGAAGLAGDELLAALCGPPAGHLAAGRLLVSPHPVPASAADAVAWFADCRRFAVADLKEHHGA
jgi:imidazolonepropionase-like amidohydrolase